MSIASHNESVSSAAIGDYAAGPAEYFALLKPRVMSLVIWTALAGLLVAPTHVHPVIAVASILAIAVGAGAAGALNMWQTLRAHRHSPTSLTTISASSRRI